MKNLDNLKAISIRDIKSCLKQVNKDEFDKMIIDENTIIKRSNYFYVQHNSVVAERHGKVIKFPIYGSIKDNFSSIEGGIEKHGDKKILETEELINTLSSKYNILPTEYKLDSIDNPYDYPLDANGENVNFEQRKYFFPNLTYQEQCFECNGHKYVTCDDPDCKGQHVYDCTSCHGSRKVTCSKCNGSGFESCKNCNGSGDLRCLKCKGRGEIKCPRCKGEGIDRGTLGGKLLRGAAGMEQKFDSCRNCGGSGLQSCPDCRGGYVKCNICNGRGEVRCSRCSGRGEVDCSTCDATGKLTCEYCYGDKERYGMIDCPVCKTQGYLGQLVFIETTVFENSYNNLFLTGDKLQDIDENNIVTKHADKNAETQLTMINLNDIKKEYYDEHNEHLSAAVHDNLGYTVDSFPKIIEEKMSYQIIPCVQLEYKHMLTNEIHSLTIVNFFESPEVILHSKAEELKKDFKNSSKVVGGLFGKVFKTKKFKSKEDKKNEIVLMIYLAKADGKIEEEEKQNISELIGSLDDFSVSEKQSIFDLMNSNELPELTIKQVTFSSKERADEVVNNLAKLSSADGEVEPQELAFIDKIKSMLKYK